MSWTPRAAERVAGTLSILAAVVHGGLTPAHLEEWWGYGLVFIAAALAQTVLGIALLVEPIATSDPLYGRVKGWMYAAGAVGNLLLVGLYVVTRLVAIPVGPDPHVELVDAVGVATVAVEVATAAILGALLGRRRAASD